VVVVLRAPAASRGIKVLLVELVADGVHERRDLVLVLLHEFVGYRQSLLHRLVLIDAHSLALSHKYPEM
jgi:hypothetical protein